MKLCDPRHPEHYGLGSDGRYRGWGGLATEMPIRSKVPFFQGVTLHRAMTGRLVAEFEGVWYELWPSGRFGCCRVHAAMVELLLVARQPWAVQTHPFPVLDRNQPGPYGRAFLHCRRLARKRREMIGDRPTTERVLHIVRGLPHPWLDHLSPTPS